MNETATLLVSCTDRKGLVASISNFVFQHGGNFLNFDQHTDTEAGVFLARVEWELNGFQLPSARICEYFQPIASANEMRFEIFLSAHVPKVAIFASRLAHCLHDLLLRQRAGEFRAEIAIIIGNHLETEDIARSYGVDFHYFPIDARNKSDQERAEIAELRSLGVELVVLARYMQILSGDFISYFPSRIMNIHHSFLPAFIGAQPYHQAFRRGVKLIGATAHYVTSELDNGPIIEQQVVRISHRDCVEDLIRKGRDLEKVVLARAVRLHLDHRILTYGNRTVVFD
jgi:formyltetrahydrofolate deformylase